MAKNLATPVIGIDASRMAGVSRTGTENYADQIIRALLALPVPWRWRLYFNGHANDASVPESENVEIREIPARRLWTHRRLSQELLCRRPAGLFVPSHVIPLVHPPSVVTIHDLGYLRQPESHPHRQRMMLDVTTRWSAKVARHIVVPSGRTRDDLIELYDVSASRITVIPHGVHPRFAGARDENISGVPGHYALYRPYILAVGTIQPRKDLPILARSMRLAGINHDLVIAGKRGWMADSVLRDLQDAGLGPRLRLLEYVPDDDLPALYRHADIFVHPSRYEGFGMPVLEAMASGTPVIAARGSSLVEVGGDAAVYFTEGDAGSLATRLRELLADPQMRNEFCQRGALRAESFTWERTAQKTRTLLEESLIRER